MNTQVQTALPSIRNRALMVSVSFHKPQMTKLDRKATQDAEQANNAHGALKTQKMLYPKHLVDPITSLESQVYNYLKSNTLRWGDSGMYLLDASRFMEFADRMERYRIERKQLVTVFAQNWANVMSQAQQQQGALFDPSVYPDVTEVASQFTMNVAYLPVGDLGTDLFDNVEQEIRDAITQEVSKTTDDLLKDTVRQPIQRLMTSVLHIYDKLAREDSRIYDSMMGNLEELVEQIPALNVLDIPEITMLANYCRDNLIVPTDAVKGDTQTRQDVKAAAHKLIEPCGINPDTALKLSDAERRQLADKATDAILASMRGFM